MISVILIVNVHYSAVSSVEHSAVGCGSALYLIIKLCQSSAVPARRDIYVHSCHGRIFYLLVRLLV